MAAKAYDPDSICWALGIGQLDPGPVSAGWALRVLMVPSFHAEVCVTLTAADATSCVAEVVVPAERVWIAGTIPQFVSRATVELGVDVAAAPPRVPRPPPEPGHGIQIDGMSFAAVLRSPGESREIEGAMSERGEDCRWLRELLATLHARVGDAACARGLADAGLYANLDLGSPVPPPSPVRIAVLGQADERVAVIRALSDAQALRNKPKLS